jgi:hypothetical protein
MNSTLIEMNVVLVVFVTSVGLYKVVEPVKHFKTFTRPQRKPAYDEMQ